MRVPDNYDAFLQKEAEEEAWLRRCPICEYCGEPIQDEFLFDIDGCLYHEDCAGELFRKDTDNYLR